MLYSSVLEQANEWLSANTEFRLLKCESIRKRIMDGPKLDFDSVLYHESSNGKNYFLSGLRYGSVLGAILMFRCQTASYLQLVTVVDIRIM